MAAIGIDTHKDSLACCLIDDLGQPLDERTIPNDPAGHAALVAWVRSLDPVPLVGLEGSASYGAAAARVLRGGRAGVPGRCRPSCPTGSAGQTRRAGKSDPGDALAIARVVARERELPPVRLEDGDDRARPAPDRPGAAGGRGDPGAQRRPRPPARAAAGLRRHGPQPRRGEPPPDGPGTSPGPAGGPGRPRPAGPRPARPTSWPRAARSSATSAARVAGHPLLGHARGRTTRGRDHPRRGSVIRAGSGPIGALAMLAGVAPIPASSGQVRRVRLNRGGDRQLNRAFWTIALTQIRTHPPARAYYRAQARRGQVRTGGHPEPQAPSGPGRVPSRPHTLAGPR